MSQALLTNEQRSNCDETTSSDVGTVTMARYREVILEPTGMARSEVRALAGKVNNCRDRTAANCVISNILTPFMLKMTMLIQIRKFSFKKPASCSDSAIYW